MKHTCPHCGASTESTWHAITPGLVTVLLKVYKRICDKGENDITMSELDLDHSEYGNFQKLRFHALIAKDKTNPKHWVITQRGTDFLKQKIQIPRRVETYRNHVRGHSDDYVTVRDVMISDPYWQKLFEGRPQPVSRPVEFAQNGQGIMFQL